MEKVNEEFEMMNGIFDNDIEDIKAHEVANSYSPGDPNIYAVSINHEKAVNKNYKAVGRFVPNPRNTKEEKLNILMKYMYFLPHPDNPTSKLVVDCTSNWGQRDNIISKAFFHCRNSNNPALVALGKKHFSRKSYYFSLYQILKDIQQPELNGEIKVLRFANQVNEIIKDITTSDEATDKVAVNYSHPLTGRDFILDIREETYKDEKTGRVQKMTSYTKSKFKETSTMLRVPQIDWNDDKLPILRDENGEVKWLPRPEKPTKEYMREIFKYLKEKSPNLADYKAKKWTPEQEEEIIEAVRLTIDDPYHFDAIYRKMYKKKYTGGVGESMSTQPESSKSGMKLEMSNAMKQEIVNTVSEPKVTTQKSQPTQDVYSEPDELPDGFDDEFSDDLPF